MVSQNMVLNKILATKDLSMITTNNLTEDYFFAYTAEFLFIMNHKKTYGVVPDKLTFLDHFPNFDIVEVNEPDTYLLEQLFNDYNQSILANGFNTVKKYLEAENVQAAMDYYNKLGSLQHTGAVLTCTNLLTDTTRYDHYLDRTVDKHQYYVSTGLPELDTVIGGIDRKNENLVIYARTGQGKTQVMMYMAAAAVHQGLRVGIYEGEMTTDKTGYRFDTCYGHIKNKSINRGDLYVQQEYKHYIDMLAADDNKAVFVITPNDVPGGKVTVNSLKTFVEQQQLDILFVDQYDLLDDISNAKQKHERIGNIAKDVKLLQVEKQIPIVSVCQMTREKNEDGTIDSTQVAGSDMISRYATVLLALEQKFDQATGSVELDITVVKARDGGDHNKLKYTADFDIGYLTYIPNEKDGITSEQELQNIADSYEIASEDSGY